MKKSLLLVFIFIGVASEAQIKRYTFKAGANYAIIPDVTHKEEMELQIPPSVGFISMQTTTASIRQQYKERAGFDAGASLDVGLSKKFFLTTGLSVSYLRFKQSMTITTLESNTIDMELPTGGVIVGAPIGSIKFEDLGGDRDAPMLITSDKNGETATLYLQTPLLAGTTFFKDRLIVRGGATISYLLNATTYKMTASYQGGTLQAHDVKVDSREGYTELLASATVQATYLVTKRIGVDFSANKFLSPIYSGEDSSSDKAKYNTLALGVSYSLTR